jgi:hypothetical protein
MAFHTDIIIYPFYSIEGAADLMGRVAFYADRDPARSSFPQSASDNLNMNLLYIDMALHAGFGNIVSVD